MPCRDYSDDDRCELELCQLRKALDEAPKPSLLCEAMVLLDEHDLLHVASEELKQWYLKHEEREQHNVRLEAAEKLTKRERKLLGIDIYMLRKLSQK